MKKDLLLMWRNKLQTLFELVLPSLYVVFIFVYFNPKESDLGKDVNFEGMPIYGNSTDLHQHSANIPSIGALGDVAYFSNNEIGHSLIDLMQNSYGQDVTFSKFDDFEAMISSIQKKYARHSYVAAIHMQSIQRDPAQLQYTFYLPENNGHDAQSLNSSLENFWLKGMSDSISTDVDLTFPTNPNYYYSGYLSLQLSLEKTFLEKVMNKSMDHVVLQRMPALSKNKALFVSMYGSSNVTSVILSMKKRMELRHICSQWDLSNRFLWFSPHFWIDQDCDSTFHRFNWIFDAYAAHQHFSLDFSVPFVRPECSAIGHPHISHL
uniref:Uncharacterized protein n=1 Tax=Ditylenchus dipsaci TaxID=166011 RepID=A0A915E079_9BILA